MPPSSHPLRQPAPAPDLSPAVLKLKRKVDADGQGNQPRPTSHVNNHRKRRKSHRRRRALRTEDDCELQAADRNLAVPNNSKTRIPRLERQGAFRIPSTWRDPDASLPADADDENRDLYRLGLLYDDEHLRGPGFSLDIIVHPDPVYSVRPARRTRKPPPPHRDTDTDTEFDEFDEARDPGPLTLGFQSGSLYDDMVRAQQLPSTAPETADDDLHAPGAAEVISTPLSQSRDRRRGGRPSPTRGRNAPPLAVIYETQESSLPSPPATPMATSQLDLVLGEVDEDFMLLEDAVSDVAEEDGSEVVLSSATGDPWVLLGDGSQAATDSPMSTPESSATRL